MTSDAQKRANKKYNQEIDRVSLRMPKGKRARIQKHIEENSPGTSLNRFINEAIDEKMEEEERT